MASRYAAGRVVDATEAAQQVGTCCRQEVVPVELADLGNLVDDGEADVGAVGHGDGDRPVELDDRAGRELGEAPVERGDLQPVGVLGLRRGGVAGGDGGLQLVRTRAAAGDGGVERRRCPSDPLVVPPRPVLLVEGDDVTALVDPCRAAGVVELHQGEQPDGFGLVGQQVDEEPGQADRLGRHVDAIGARHRRSAR